MTIESRLTDVEESLRLLRDANRLQGRPLSAKAPSDKDRLVWNNTTKKWEPTAGITRTANIPLGSFNAHTGSPGFQIQGTHTSGWSFDADATDESITSAVPVPQDYSSGGSIRLYYYMASATSGDVVWTIYTVPAIEGEDFTAEGQINTATDTVQGTAANLGAVDITITGTIAAGDLLRVRVRRSGSNGSDTASGDAELMGVAFVYTSLF